MHHRVSVASHFVSFKRFQLRHEVITTGCNQNLELTVTDLLPY